MHSGDFCRCHSHGGKECAMKNELCKKSSFSASLEPVLRRLRLGLLFCYAFPALFGGFAHSEVAALALVHSFGLQRVLVSDDWSVPMQPPDLRLTMIGLKMICSNFVLRESQRKFQYLFRGFHRRLTKHNARSCKHI